MRAFAEVELGQDDYDSWHDAEPCLTQPDTAFERIFRMPIWRYYAEHSERGALFGEAMTNLTAIANAGVLGSYQFATFSNAVDVGGGHGSFLAASSITTRQRRASCSTFLRSSKTLKKLSSSRRRSLAKAGFQLERVTATKSPFSVVEAVPV